MPEAFLIADETIRLRTSCDSDVSFCRQLEGAGENPRFVTVWTDDQHRAAMRTDELVHAVLEDQASGGRIGFVLLRPPDAHLTSELARIVIEPPGKGYGRKALRLIKRLVFENWGAHRLWLDVKTFNQRAIALYESEGFVREGTLRDRERHGGEYHSLMILSMLESEYAK